MSGINYLELESVDGNAYIGYTPVTNEEFAAFNPGFNYSSGHERYPVVSITYSEMVAYCEWLSGFDAVHAYRLPSEFEWVMAAGHMPKDIAMNSGHILNGLTPVDAYAQSEGACGGICKLTTEKPTYSTFVNVNYFEKYRWYHILKS